MSDTKFVLDKWFYKLGFDQEYADTLKLLQKEAKLYSVERLDYEILKKKKNPILNLVYFLYKCEELSEKYKEHGINESILIDTLSDIRIWANTYYDYSEGKFGIEEIDWLEKHIEFRLFKLGRLQFAFGKAEQSSLKEKISKEDNIIEVHIPKGGPLAYRECIQSFEFANYFFETYFPHYQYTFYTCYSWLLDDNLKELLKDNSNIIKFADMFTKLYSKESYAAIKYLFKWTDSKNDLKKLMSKNSFQKKIIDYILSGGVLNETYGIINKNNFETGVDIVLD